MLLKTHESNPTKNEGILNTQVKSIWRPEEAQLRGLIVPGWQRNCRLIEHPAGLKAELDKKFHPLGLGRQVIRVLKICEVFREHV